MNQVRGTVGQGAAGVYRLLCAASATCAGPAPPALYLCDVCKDMVVMAWLGPLRYSSCGATFTGMRCWSSTVQEQNKDMLPTPLPPASTVVLHPPCASLPPHVCPPPSSSPGHEMRANKAAATSYNTQLQLATAQVAIEAPLTKLVGAEPRGSTNTTTTHAGSSSGGAAAAAAGGGGAQAAGAGSSGAGGSGRGLVLGAGADGNPLHKSSKKGKGPGQAPDSVYLPPKTTAAWLAGGGGSYPVFTPSYAAMLPGPVSTAAGAAAAGGGGSSSSSSTGSGKRSVFAAALRLHWALKAEEVKATLGRWADAAAAGEVKTRLQQVAGRVAAALARLPPPGQQQEQKQEGQQQEPQQGQDVGDWRQQHRYQQQPQQQLPQQPPPKPPREEVVMLDDSDDDEAAREVLTPPKRARRAGPAAPPQGGSAAAGSATSTEAVSAAYMAAVAATAAAERAAAAAQQAVIHLSQEQQLGMAGMGGGVGASSAGPAGRVGRGGGRGAPDDAGILDLTGWEEDMMSGEVGEAGGAPPPGAAAAPALAGEGEVEVLDLT
jgi:hypothetical protein